MFRSRAMIIAGAAAVALVPGCDRQSSDRATPTTSVSAPTTTTVPARTATTVAGQSCDPSPTVIRDATATLAPIGHSDDTAWRWALPDPGAQPDVNDICAPLSAAVVTIRGATGSSPEQALLFHNGTYVGPATPDPRSYINVDKTHTTADTVVLTYKTPGKCSACSEGAHFYCVQFHWDGQQVITTGKPPEWNPAGGWTPGSQPCAGPS